MVVKNCDILAAQQNYFRTLMCCSTLGGVGISQQYGPHFVFTENIIWVMEHRDF